MRKALKWIGIGLGALIALVLITATTFALIGRSRLNGRYQASGAIPADALSNASVEVGERIARTRGCTECHAQGLRGQVFLDIPPGKIVAPNLTKGRGGVGARYATMEDWDRAVRFGVRPDSSLLLPFMPYELFRRLSDADAASLAAYLANLPPVDNELPALEVRALGHLMMGLPNMNPKVKLAELSKPITTPPPGPTAEYGKYVASTTCVVCHGENLLGGPHPNPDAPPGPGLSHVGAWSIEDFTKAMRTGVVPAGRQMSDFMPWKDLAHLTDEELRAVHEYVKTIEP